SALDLNVFATQPHGAPLTPDRAPKVDPDLFDDPEAGEQHLFHHRDHENVAFTPWRHRGIDEAVHAASLDDDILVDERLVDVHGALADDLAQSHGAGRDRSLTDDDLLRGYRNGQRQASGYVCLGRCARTHFGFVGARALAR